LPFLKTHLEGDDLNLTATLLELTAEICKSGVLTVACMVENHWIIFCANLELTPPENVTLRDVCVRHRLWHLQPANANNEMGLRGV
jgi:hypothetical protein